MQSNLQALDTYSVMTGDRRYEKLLGESEGVSNMCDVAQRLRTEELIASGIDKETVDVALTCL